MAATEKPVSFPIAKSNKFVFKLVRGDDAQLIMVDPGQALQLLPGDHAQLIAAPAVPSELIKDGTDLIMMADNNTSLKVSGFFKATEISLQMPSVKVGENIFIPPDFQNKIGISLVDSQVSRLSLPEINLFSLNNRLDQKFETYNPIETFSRNTISGGANFVGTLVEQHSSAASSTTSSSSSSPSPSPAINHAPQASNFSIAATQDSVLSVAASSGSALLNHVTDADSGDSLTITNVDTSGALSAIVNYASNGGYTFDPRNVSSLIALPAGQQQTAHLIYTVSDSHGETSVGTVAIAVTGVNDAPTTLSDTNAVIEDSFVGGSSGGSGGVGGPTGGAGGPTGGSSGSVTASGNLLTNDSDVDTGDSITLTAINGSSIAVAAAGTYGSLLASSNGTYTYTLSNSSTVVQQLTNGQTVTDNFVYTITDSNGATATSTLAITVSGRNDTPVAISDLGSVTEDASSNTVAGNVLTNDTDADSGDTKTVIGISRPTSLPGTIGVSYPTSYGSIILNSDGSYTYTLNNSNLSVQAIAAGQIVADSVQYTMQDSLGATAVASINILITGTNDAPVAVVNTTTAVEELITTTTGNLLTNDTDPDVADSHVVVSIGGATVSALSPGTITSSYGTLIVTSSGSYTYTLNNSATAVQSLAAGATVTDTFAYVQTDNRGGFATSSLVVTISGLNDAPVAGSYSVNTDEDTILTVAAPGLISAATDIDGNSLTLTPATLFSTRGAYVTISSNGQYIYDPSVSSQIQGLNQGDTLTDTFIYNISDGSTVVPGTATLILTGVNDAPIAQDNSAVILEGSGSVGSNVKTDDHDPDTSATLTLTAVAGSATNIGVPVSVGHYGTFTINADGTYLFAIDNANTQVQQLNVGQTLVDSITYTITDEHGASDVGTLAITIQGTNDAPSLTPDSVTYSTLAITPITGNVLSNDSDVDSGSAFSVTGVDASGAGSTVVGTYGSFVINSNGSYTYLIDIDNSTVTGLASGATLTDSVSYIATDDQGATATSSLTVSIVGPINTFNANDDTATVSQSSTLTGNVISNDDAGLNGGLSLSGGTQTFTGSYGTLVLENDGDYTYTANSNVSGSDNFTYTLVDAVGHTDVATLSVTVNNTHPVEILINTHDSLETSTINNNSAYPGINLAANRAIRAVIDGSLAPITQIQTLGNSLLYLGTVANDILTGDINSADSLSGDDGDDTINGDYKQQTWTASESSDFLFNNFSDVNANTLLGDGGNDKIYGNIQLISVSNANQSNLLPGAAVVGNTVVGTVAVNTSNTLVTAATNTLTGGEGDDTIIGNVGGVTLSILAGSTVSTTDAISSTVTSFTSSSSNHGLVDSSAFIESFGFGADSINGNNGNDTLVGDVNAVSIIINTDSQITTGQASGSVNVDGTGTTVGAFRSASSTNLSYAQLEGSPNTTARFAADTINGGDGNNILIGDLNTFAISSTLGSNLQTAAATANSKLTGVFYNFGGANLSAATTSSSYISTFSMPGETLTMGADSFSVSGTGNNTLIGDLSSISFGVTTGSNLMTGAASSSGITHYGGSSFSISISLAANANSYIAGQFSNSSRYTFGSDTGMQTSSGTDTIIGDLNSYQFIGNVGSNMATGSATAGKSTSNSYINANIVESSVFNFGSETSINAGGGNDTVVGDVNTFTYQFASGSVIQSGNATFSQSDYISTAAGTDNLSVNYSNYFNNIDGTLGVKNFALALDSITGSASTGPSGGANSYVNVSNTVTGVGLNFGNDTNMQGGDGADLLIGDAKTINWSLTGGSSLTAGNAIAAYRFDDASTSSSAQATITGTATANSYINASAAIISTTLALGADSSMNGGDGNDTLVGDIQSISLALAAGSSLTAGNATASLTTTGTTPPSGDSVNVTLSAQSYVDGTASIQATRFNFGSETSLEGGAGNDIVYGDIQSLSLSLAGGLAVQAGNVSTAISVATVADLYTNSSNANASAYSSLNNVQFNFGSDVVYGDDVSNAQSGTDTLYGDANALSIDLIGGTGIVVGTGNADVRAFLTNVQFNAGSDTLYGGQAADTLYGDFNTIHIGLTDGSTISDTGLGVVFAQASITNTTLTQGNDVLDGGAGDDTLSGDAVQYLTALNTLRSEDVSNLVDWGNDTLTGGAGNDKFVFALDAPVSNNIMSMQGVDVVTDFTIGQDKLVFGNTKDLNSDTLFTALDLDNGAVFINLTNINALAIIFRDPAGVPGSITADTNITNATSISNAITAIENNSNTHGAIILEGHSTSTISSFSALDALNGLEVHSNDTLI
jgi:VCBS repeat-containing protein